MTIHGETKIGPRVDHSSTSSLTKLPMSHLSAQRLLSAGLGLGSTVRAQTSSLPNMTPHKYPARVHPSASHHPLIHPPWPLPRRSTSAASSTRVSSVRCPGSCPSVGSCSHARRLRQPLRVRGRARCAAQARQQPPEGAPRPLHRVHQRHRVHRAPPPQPALLGLPRECAHVYTWDTADASSGPLSSTGPSRPTRATRRFSRASTHSRPTLSPRPSSSGGTLSPSRAPRTSTLSTAL